MSRRKKKRSLEGLQHIMYSEMVDKICQDYGIDPKNKLSVHFNTLRVVNGKRVINGSCSAIRGDSIIVDRDGNEHPYSLNSFTRNEEKLVDFEYIYRYEQKSLSQVEIEAGIELDAETCRICEGGGWTSQGTRWFYKEFYCES